MNLNNKFVKITALGLGSMFFLVGCATKELPKQDNPAIVGGYTQQINFNYVADANISNYDARVRSIVYVSKQNPSGVAVIRFNDINAKGFTKYLADILSKEGVKSEIIGYANKANAAQVSVYVKFIPMDKAVKTEVVNPIPNNNLKKNAGETKSNNANNNEMTNITSIVNN